MTLQKINLIKISNWRSWEGETVLDNIEPGLIVFNGPNAIGKSGVWEAIVAGLLDKQRGSHTERFRPAGSSGLVPTVKIEFTADGRDYRITKRFHRQQASSGATLYEKTSGSWKIIEEDADNAFLTCRQIVAGNEATDLSRGGFEKALKDNLMQLLLPIQGSLVELATAPKSLAGLGVDSAMNASATQLGRILTLVSADMTMWNKDRKKLKKSDLKTHGDRLNAIRGEVASFEEDSTRIEQLVTRICSVNDALEATGDTKSRLQEASTLQSEADEHRKKREKTFARLEETRNKEKICQEGLGKRRSVVAAIKEKTNVLEDVGKNIERLKPTLKDTGEQREHLQQKYLEKRSELRALRDWLDSETRGSRISEKKLNQDRVDSRLSMVDKAQTELDKLNQALANIKLPDKKGWKIWDSLDERRKLAKGKLDAESWQLTGSLPQGFLLRIDGEEASPGEVTGLASKKIEIFSPDRSHQFTAMTSSSDTHSFQKAQEEADEFLRRFNVSTIEELRSNFSQATEIEKEIGRAESKRSTVLDGNSRDELIRESARLSQDIESLKAVTTHSSRKPDGEPEEWKIRIKILEEELEKNQRKIDETNENFSSLKTRYQSEEAKKLELESELKESKQLLHNECEERGDDETIRKTLETAARECSEAKTAWKFLDDLKEIAETQKYSRANKLRGELEDVFKKQSQISELEGKLVEMRKNDPEGELVRLRAEESKLKEIVASEQIQADALLLLEGILAQEVRKHTDAVGGPVRKQMQTWLGYILQDNSELIVSENGLPHKVRNPAAQEIEFCEQSFGTREQISLLYRLAIAGLLAEKSKSGVCLMFDDPFGHTDKGRRERMLAVMESEVAKYGHQILLFTCRPEDFSGCGSHQTLVGGA